MSDDKVRRWNSSLSTRKSSIRRFQRSGKPPERKTRIKAIGRRGKRQRREGEVDGDVCRAARLSRCPVTGRIPTSERANHAHHIREQGESRIDWRDGECRVMPLDPAVHRDWHALDSGGWRRKYGTGRPTKDELAEIAREFGERFIAGETPC